MDYYSIDHGLVTVRDLVALAPGDLLREKNMGKRTLADTRAVLERFLGTTWEQAHDELRYANHRTDIPGGAEASARAIQVSVAALHAAGGALKVSYLHALFVDLGAPFDRWTPSMVSSVLREDARFRVMRDRTVRLREGRTEPHSSSTLPEEDDEISRASG
jgi:hypothetical protein